MRWCSLQTNEHDLQAIMYPIICKYHRLNINNGNKVPVFPGYICNRWQNMIVQPSQTHNHGKIWQQWERWILPIWWLRLCDLLSLRWFVPWINHLFLHVCPTFGKSSLSKRVCKFDKFDSIYFFFIVKMHIEMIIELYNYFILFYSYFT